MKNARKLTLAAVLVLFAIGSVFYANGLLNAASNAAGYICTVTGETLPCPNCCPF